MTSDSAPPSISAASQHVIAERSWKRNPSLRLLVVATMITVTAIPLLFLAFYGIHGGMPWDYHTVTFSERNRGLEGFLYRDMPLRIYTNIFYHLGYHVSRMIGLDGSWVGFHAIYALLWIAKGLLVYWLCRLLDLNEVIAGGAAALATFHGSDLSIGHVGQINQYGVVFWVLLSMCLFLSFLRSSRYRYIALLGATVASYLAVWSHEASLFGLLLSPLLLTWLLGPQRVCYIGAGVATLPPLVYSYLMAQQLIFHPTGESFQERVLRQDLTQISNLISDYFYLVVGLFYAPAWVPMKMHDAELSWADVATKLVAVPYILAAVLAIGFVIALAVAAWQSSPQTANRRLLAIATVCVVFMTAFIAPFLALNVPANGFWRTQLLPSPFACVAFMIGLYLLAIRAIESHALRATVIAGPVAVALSCGFVANALSYENYNNTWDTLRDPIERLLLAVPAVKDGTIIMLQDVPPLYLWGGNFWFDHLLRLAYPRISVAGSYTHALVPSNATAVQAVVAAGGKLVTLASDRQVLAPAGHLFSISGDRVSLARTYLPPLIAAGGIEQVVAVRWIESGPFQVVASADDIAVAVGPRKENYNPYARIEAPMSDVARRRFTHR